MRLSLTQESSKNFIEHAVRQVAQEKNIIDVGGGERFTKWLAPYEALFKGKTYRTLDSDPTTHPDILGSVSDIPLEDASADAILCSSVLEHIPDPLRAFSEIKRILRPGGILFFYVPSLYPYHARLGHYGDYWRFFNDTINELCRDFSSVEVRKRGGYFLALSFFVPFQHRMRPLLNFIAQSLDLLLKTKQRTTTAGFYVLARK